MQLCWQSIFVIFVVLAFGLNTPKSATAQREAPFDVFGDSIDNRVIIKYLESKTKALVESQPKDAVATILEQLESATHSSDVKFDSLTNAGTATKEKLYQHMIKSSLFFGILYDCGRCDRTHSSFSGAVVISEDGLILTNHHVLQTNGQTRTEGFMAMTWDGRCFMVEKVIAVDETADIALLQLKADGYKFHAAPIAAKRPTPMDPVRVISHPSGEFFALTQGEVSRYAVAKKQIWMEITADFGRGSSGSGVFNDQGEVVGVVSRIHPIIRDKQKKAGADARKGGNAQSYTELVFKRCVPLRDIHACFAKEAEPAAVPHEENDAIMEQHDK